MESVKTHGIEYDKEINIAISKTRTAKKWKNKQVLISEFIKKLSQTTRTDETVDQYIDMPKTDQDKIKDVGSFVGGLLKDGLRSKSNVANRHILTFDLDYARLDTVEKIKTELKDVCFTIYSTHKHRPTYPRLRLIIYPDRPLLPDEYHPVCRKIADQIDIELFDHTGFDINRLFYLPSTCQDGEFIFYHNDMPFYNVDHCLRSYGLDDAWKNAELWPRSIRERKNFESQFKKQADPLSKKNIIGAFCRVVSIRSALDDYLADVYRKESESRYTFINGTSTNGLIVYDDRFCYSNHATDPACGQTCNAFDIIRIHKFGHLDNNDEPDTTKKPSYDEMVKFARAIPEVGVEFAKTHVNVEPITVDDFDDFDDTWFSNLEVTEKGIIKPTFYNASLIIQNDPKIKHAIRFNQFSIKKENTQTGETWTDTDTHNIRIYVGKKYRVDFPESKIYQNLETLAEKNGYHPVRDYLNGLKWDGVARIETIFIDYMGYNDNVYSREIAKCWFTAAVYRVFEPGYKFDNAIVLSGRQETGKTTFAMILGRNDWYGELSSFENKVAIEEISGKWIVEINEMGATNKQALEQQKSFLSACSTRVRPAYGREPVDYKRQCVFIGTTNETEYLKDTTGNRRWWPIDCLVDFIDVDKLRTNVDQIWAEAVVMYSQSHTTVLSRGAKEIALELQNEKLQSDPWHGIIREWLNQDCSKTRYEPGLMNFGDDLEQRDRVCAQEIWEDCLKMNGKPKRTESLSICACLDSLKNWERKDKLWCGKRFGYQRGWMKKRF